MLRIWRADQTFALEFAALYKVITLFEFDLTIGVPMNSPDQVT